MGQSPALSSANFYSRKVTLRDAAYEVVCSAFQHNTSLRKLSLGKWRFHLQVSRIIWRTFNTEDSFFFLNIHETASSQEVKTQHDRRKQVILLALVNVKVSLLNSTVNGPEAELLKFTNYIASMFTAVGFDPASSSNVNLLLNRHLCIYKFLFFVA